MNVMIKALMVLVSVALLSGCGTTHVKRGGGSSLVTGMAANNMSDVSSDRMLIWKAHLSICLLYTSDAADE